MSGARPLLDDGEIHVCWLRRPRGSGQAPLRRALAPYVGVDADAITLRIGAHGKPMLVGDADLQFNWSHCGEAAVLAVARGVEVGIDIESLDRRISARALAQRYFAASENAALEQCEETQYRRAFLRLWTAKEAVLKALGRGLAFGLDRVVFDCADDSLELRDMDAEDVAAWQLRSLIAPWPAHAVTLAWRGGPRRLRFMAAADASATPPQRDRTEPAA